MKRGLQYLLVGGAFALSFATVGIAGEGVPANRFVAGTTPWQRPTQAPVIKTHVVTPEMRSAMLKGVSEPVPASLKFLNDQGAWYTPFDRPGMPGYYDLRQMHGSASAKPRP